MTSWGYSKALVTNCNIDYLILLCILVEKIAHPCPPPFIHLSPFLVMFIAQIVVSTYLSDQHQGERGEGVSKPALRPAQNSFSVRLDILQEICVKISFTSFSGQCYRIIINVLKIFITFKI